MAFRELLYTRNFHTISRFSCHGLYLTEMNAVFSQSRVCIMESRAYTNYINCSCWIDNCSASQIAFRGQWRVNMPLMCERIACPRQCQQPHSNVEVQNSRVLLIHRVSKKQDTWFLITPNLDYRTNFKNSFTGIF